MSEESTTSLKTYQTCKRKYYFAYDLLLKPRQENIHFIDGRIYHSVMQNYHTYKAGIIGYLPIPVSSLVLMGFPEEKIGYLSELSETGDVNLLGRCAGYIKKYSNKEFAHYEAEKTFKIPLDGDWVVGKRDAIVTDFDGDMWLLEHKTTSESNEVKYIEKIEEDIQPIIYWWSYYMEHGEELKGIIYRVAKKPRYRLKIGESEEAFNKRIVKSYITEPDKHYFEFKIDKNIDDIKWVVDEIKELTADINKEKELWVRDRQRCWDYSGCEFLPLCENRVIDTFTINSFYQKKTSKHEEIENGL